MIENDHLQRMKKPVKAYDIVLLFATFRRVIVYLSIVKELSQNYRIGIYPFRVLGKEKEKTYETDTLFLNFCKDHGADILNEFPVSTRSCNRPSVAI